MPPQRPWAGGRTGHARGVLLPAALLLAAPALAQPFGGGTLVPLSALPLRTQGRDIVGAHGRRVPLFCVNWYGAHMEQMVSNGLNRQPLPNISAHIAVMGFNCVRLPFSLALVFGNATRVPDAEVALAANPELQNMTAMETFDATVAALTNAGLLVILNNHVSAPKWCCSVKDGESLWYTDEYPEAMWLEALGSVAARYRGDARVVGFDLRNELRFSGTVYPTWGTGDRKSDWAAAAAEGGKRVLAASPDLLIVVSGLHFCGFLCDVARRPLHESEPELRGRVVYTAHEYPWFNLHLSARWLLERAFKVLAVAWATVCVLLFAWRIWRCWRRDVPGRRCPRCCCWGTPGRWELGAASLVTASALLLLVLGGESAKGCGTESLMRAIGCFLGAFCLGLLALVLWLRLAVLATLAMDQRLFGARRAEPSGEAALGGESSSDRKWAMHTNKLPGEASEEDPEGAALPVPACGSPEQRPPLPPRSQPELEAQKAPSLHQRLRRRARPAAAVLRSVDCLAVGGTAACFAALLLVWRDLGSYETFEAELDDRWGFLLHGRRPGGGEEQTATSPAPVWLGEFGTDWEDNLWWKHLMRYCEQNSVDWAYWSLNGEMRPGKQETYGLLKQDAVSVRHHWKLDALQRLIRLGAAPA